MNVKWNHKTMKRGRISFAFRQSAEIVDGVFEAPDDPGLTERLKALGHTPLPAKIMAEVISEVTTDGAPAPDGERPTGGKAQKGR